MARITSVTVKWMTESCERWTYYVDLVSDEGFSNTVASYRTGSNQNNFEGLLQDEARDRALIMAGRWADFLRLDLAPFVDQDGLTYQPSMEMLPYSDQRDLNDLPADLPQVVGVTVSGLWESCERWTYYVSLVTDEGFSNGVVSHRTGSVYTNFEGLTQAEARDRALIDAGRWADFLQYDMPPFVDKDGVTYSPGRLMTPFMHRRVLAARKAAKTAAAAAE